MAYSFTPAQRLAIDTRDKSLLVSAAAGSGKTATLTERIISSITDKDAPVDIDSLLVVTFTRAAASELRQRISSSLSDALAADPTNKHLAEQLLKMSGAKISTIDSFYLEILRSNFDKLDISPSFRTADESELNILARSLMEDTIDDFYDAHKQEFSKITECFVNVRNGANLSNIFLDLYSKTESLPDGILFLKKASEKAADDSKKDLLDGSFGSLIISDISEAMRYYIDAFESFSEKYSELSSLPFLIYDITFAQHLCSILEDKNYSACQECLNSYSPLKRPDLKKIGLDPADIEILCKIRDSFKDNIRKHIIPNFFSISPDNISEVMKSTADITGWIYELLSSFEERFTKEKQHKNVMSFTDIRRYALKLLVNEDGTPTDTAIEYSKKFTQIYIDEYQDVDLVQDLIFRAISKPTARFMVGDIKQSIYGFRGAEPDVFASYRKTFPDISLAKSSDTASIFMSDNFRCDSTVIRFTNAVCSTIFEECADSIGYTSSDDLIFSKITNDRVVPEIPAELTVIVPDDSEKESSAHDEDEQTEKDKQIEAKYIAGKIQELLANGKKANGKKILPHDIAVLYRAKNMGTYLCEELSALGISSTSDADTDYFENPDVLLVLCLLNAIDNPQRDIYLAGLLRSPLFEFSLDELITIRKSADNSLSLYDALREFGNNDNELSAKCKHFDDILTSFRDAATAMPVDKLLKHLYASDLFVSAGLLSSDASNNLVRLYEYARKFEASSFKGLYNFISYINKMIEQKEKMPSDSDISSEGKVSLLSIHHSKGLEFPVCFVSCTGSAFYMPELKESLVFDSHFGAAMKISDASGLARIDTPMRKVIIGAMKKRQVEEEMRILYVALTRAREQLIVTGVSKSKYDSLISKAALNRKFKCRYSVLKASTYLDWILTALDPEKDYPFCKISFIEKQDVKISKASTETIEETTKDISDKDFSSLLESRFSFVYPHKAATTLPAKISVSSLINSKENEDVQILFDEASRKEYLVPSILEGKNKSLATPAQRGTATHLFLQFCNFDNLKKYGVDAEMKRLINEKYIPDNSTDIIFKNEIDAFIESELFGKIQKASKLYREQRFNIILPTSMLCDDPSFVAETEDEFLAVQGVIDIVIEDSEGNIFLYDYKTDRLSRQALEDKSVLSEKMKERHQKQILYYAEAVSRLFGKRCSGAFIYSTHAGACVEIPI